MEKAHEIRNSNGIPKIEAVSDYRDIRIYINDLLFACIPRPLSEDPSKASIWLQSYLEGSRKAKRYYIHIEHSGGNDYYGFDNYEVWKKVLQLLDEHI